MILSVSDNLDAEFGVIREQCGRSLETLLQTSPAAVKYIYSASMETLCQDEFRNVRKRSGSWVSIKGEIIILPNKKIHTGIDQHHFLMVVIRE